MRRYKILQYAVSFLLAAVLLIPGTAVSADETVLSEDDLNIEIDAPQQVTTGQYLSIKVSFEKSEGSEIQAGDMFEITWSDTLIGADDTISVLNNDKEEIGTLTVRSDGAEMSFQNDLSEEDSVTGSFRIALLANSEGTGTINIGDHTAEIQIQKGNTTNNDEDPFAGISGKLGTTDAGEPYIDWSVRVNENYTDLVSGNVTITDALPDSLTYDRVRSVSIDTCDDAEEPTGTTLEQVGGTITADGQNITLKIPSDALKNEEEEPVLMTIQFRTWINALGSNNKIKNSIETTRTINGTEETKTVSANVNVSSDAAQWLSDQKTNALTIQYVRGSNDPIEGASFQIAKLDSSNKEETNWYHDGQYAEGTTDADGKIVLKHVTAGTYEIRQTSGPSDVTSADYLTKKVVVKKQNGKVQAKTVTLKMKTKKVASVKKVQTQQAADTSTQSVKAEVEWIDDFSEHPTVYLQLYRTSANQTDPEYVTSVKLTGSDTSADFGSQRVNDDQNSAYQYFVKQTDEAKNDYTPKGYTKSEEGLKVTNRLNSEHHLIHNKLTLKKTDAKGDPLDGASFTVYEDKQCTKAIRTYEATNGKTEISTQDLSEYLPSNSQMQTLYFKETKAPDGYQIVNEAVPITLTAAESAGWNTDHTVYNTYTEYKIQSKDSTIVTLINSKKSNASAYDNAKKANNRSKTGTQTNETLWFVLVGIALIVLILVLRSRKKDK